MEKEPNYDNDGLDPSEEYFKKKEKGNDDDTYFPSSRIRTTTLLSTRKFIDSQFTLEGITTLFFNVH